MQRYAQDKTLALRRYRWFVRNAQRSSAMGELLYNRRLAPGHFRKQHPMDCGNPRCLLCSSEKVFKIPSVQQRRADEAFEDQLKNDLPSSI
jgi:hypothetical protein